MTGIDTEESYFPAFLFLFAYEVTYGAHSAFFIVHNILLRRVTQQVLEPYMAIYQYPLTLISLLPLGTNLTHCTEDENVPPQQVR